jgi:hypothetical protein
MAVTCHVGLSHYAAANSDPYTWGWSAETSVNKPVTFNISMISIDGDGDDIRLMKVGKPVHGQVLLDGTIITYKPVLELVDPKTGAQDAFTYTISDGRGGSGMWPACDNQYHIHTLMQV